MPGENFRRLGAAHRCVAVQQEGALNETRACAGGNTIEYPNGMCECVACGKRVRAELAPHPFFGFKASCTRMPVINGSARQRPSETEV